MNRVTIMGRLGQEVELRYTNGGQPVATLSVATTEKWKSKDGEAKEQTEWHKIVAWGKQAEIVEKYFQKGDQILLEGKLQTRQWEDKEGGKRYTTEIVMDKFEFVGGNTKNSTKSDTFATEGEARSFETDDIPF